MTQKNRGYYTKNLSFKPTFQISKNTLPPIKPNFKCFSHSTLLAYKRTCMIRKKFWAAHNFYNPHATI